MDASIEHSTRVGESLTREINLDIQGLASERFPEIKVSYPNSVRVYQEKPKFSELANGVTRMTIKQVIIAEQQGEVKLNDIKLNWWNSSDSSAQESVLNGLSLDVAPASALNNEPISSPSTPQPTTKTITVTDAGYWPYLTATFAVLWLATLVLLFRKCQKSPQINTQVPQTSTTADRLVNALKADDKVKASFLVRTWLDEQPYISSDLKQKIDKQVAEMNQSQYSNSSQNWRANELIALIKQTQKRTGSSRHKDQLPPL